MSGKVQLYTALYDLGSLLSNDMNFLCLISLIFPANLQERKEQNKTNWLSLKLEIGCSH